MDKNAIRNIVINHPARVVLGQGETEDERRDNAFVFTNAVAASLREAGVDAGIYVKTAGANSRGYSADIIMTRPGLELFDVVFNGEGESAAATFGEVDGLGDPERFHLPIDLAPKVPEPKPEPIPEPKPTPEPAQPATREEPITSYSEFVNYEIVELVRIYRAKNGHQPGETDIAHLAYRRLVERWDLERMKTDI